MGKKIQFVFWLVIVIVAFIFLGGVIYNFARANLDKPVHPEVTFEIANLGTIKMELYPEYAPNTVANIVKLVEKGYYDNKVIFGKDDNFLHLGTNSEGNDDIPQASLVDSSIILDSENDFAYTIPGEFSANGFKENTLCHEKGIVTLIRNNYGSALLEESYNSGISRIGIIIDDINPILNGQYAAFGRITEGLELLEKIHNEESIVESEIDEETGETIETTIDEFVNKYPVKKATVDTHGIDYGVPEMVEYFDYDEYIYQVFSSQYGA